MLTRKRWQPLDKDLKAVPGSCVEISEHAQPRFSGHAESSSCPHEQQMPVKTQQLSRYRTFECFPAVLEEGLALHGVAVTFTSWHSSCATIIFGWTEAAIRWVRG